MLWFVVLVSWLLTSVAFGLVAGPCIAAGARSRDETARQHEPHDLGGELPVAV